MAKITSPIEGFTATTYFGGMQVEFKDGVAEVEGLNDGVKNYLIATGYKVDGEQVTPPEAPAPVDSRDFDNPVQFGEPLRDAAVDPEPTDFLAPVNAGKADPHGPTVVSPEIHTSEGVRPVKPGVVHVDDTGVQDAAEKAHAESATDGTPITGPADIDLEKATKAQLIEHAESNGIDVTKSANKDEILESIRAAASPGGGDLSGNTDAGGEDDAKTD